MSSSTFEVELVVYCHPDEAPANPAEWRHPDWEGTSWLIDGTAQCFATETVNSVDHTHIHVSDIGFVVRRLDPDSGSSYRIAFHLFVSVEMGSADHRLDLCYALKERIDAFYKQNPGINRLPNYLHVTERVPGRHPSLFTAMRINAAGDATDIVGI